MLGEGSVALGDDILECAHKLLEFIDAELGLLASLSKLVRYPRKSGVVDTQNHIAEHGDEASVRVPGEARVPALGGQAFNGDVVQSKIQHRVHHARHGDGRTRPHRHEERIFRIPEALAGDGFDVLETLEGLRPEGVRPLLLAVEEVHAGLSRDGKARRHRETQVAHLRQAGALAAKQGLHRHIAFGAFAAESVDILGGHGRLPSWWVRVSPLTLRFA